MNLIEIIKSVIIGIVQGITEWLPISSTGHMILLDEFIKFIFRYVFSCNTIRLNFGGNISVFQ